MEIGSVAEGLYLELVVILSGDRVNVEGGGYRKVELEESSD